MGEFDDIRDDVADKLAEKLGIHQWYSLHMTDMCMGTYTPKPTDEDAKKNVSSCTPMKAMCMLTSPEILSINRYSGSC